MRNQTAIIIGHIADVPKCNADKTVTFTIVTKCQNDESHYTPIVCSGKQADVVMEHLSKGDLCCVEGQREVVKWADGIIRHVCEKVNVTHITFLRRRTMGEHGDNKEDNNA